MDDLSLHFVPWQLNCWISWMFAKMFIRIGIKVLCNQISLPWNLCMCFQLYQALLLQRDVAVSTLLYSSWALHFLVAVFCGGGLVLVCQVQWFSQFLLAWHCLAWLKLPMASDIRSKKCSNKVQRGMRASYQYSNLVTSIFCNLLVLCLVQ